MPVNPEKTWNRSLENVQIAGDPTRVNGTSDANNDRKSLILAITNGWINAMGSGVTVTRSCDAVSAADSDLWADITKIRWNSSNALAHSWRAFQSTTLWSGGTVYFLLNCVQSAAFEGSRLDFWVSVDGPFTGGSPTARPTAVGEQQLKNGFTGTLTNFPGVWGSGGFSDVERNYVVQQIATDDGQCNRTYIWLNNICLGYIALDRLKDPQDLTHDFAITWVGSESDTEIAPEADNLFTVDYFTYVLNESKQRIKSAYTMDFLENTEINTLINSRREDGTVGIFPAGIWSPDASFKHKWGDMFDLYWGANDAIARTHLPNDAQRDWTKIYDLVTPWDGPIMKVA